MPRITIGSIAGQDCAIVYPTRPSVNRLVVVCHGDGLAALFPTDVGITWPNLREMANYLADRGYVVAAPVLYDAGLGAGAGSTWGNDASTTQLAAVITAIQALPGVASGKYALIGGSMGNVTIANQARRVSQANIAGLLGLIPASAALAAFRGTDAAHGGFYAAINAAYAVANDAAFNAIDQIYNPLDIAPNITIPWALWTNSDDTTAAPAAAVTLAAAVPSSKGTTTNLGTGGHDFNNVTGAAVHAWLESLAW